MEYILDIAIILIVVIAVFHGRSRGFVHTVLSVAVVFIAVFGARVCADMLAPALSDRIQPEIEQSLLESVDIEGVIPDDFKFFGIPLSGAVEGAEDFAGRAGSAVVRDASSAMADSISYIIVLIAAFIILSLLLRLLILVIDLIFKLPVLNFLNSALGALAGLVLGVFVAFIAVRIAGIFTGFFTPELVEKTVIFKFLSEFGMTVI